ncbi:asialoglycoprotein receptor 2-like [Acanthaster planci]|uniref:Asialoglycoprotein receptor 2-like n=1 Tax=Acanthaster planci TaxID=133434 RepID=A0A8B8A4Z0_ACAPL|nr:asialoglycoprotein receptor 2-like [Acanthaster planci]
MAVTEHRNLKSAIIIVTTGFIVGNCAICTLGWLKHGSSCYKFASDKMTWENGSTYCQDLGGMLLVIESEEENDFITGKLRNLNMIRAWLGCSDKDSEGTWMCYADEGITRMQYENWADEKPNNFRGQDCGVIEKNKDGKWKDRGCNILRSTICEKSSRVSTMSCYSLDSDGRFYP